MVDASDEQKLYTRLSEAIVAAESHLNQNYIAIKDVWVDGKDENLGYVRVRERYRLVVGTPESHRCLTEMPVVQKVKYASVIKKIPGAIEKSKAGFNQSVEEAIESLKAFVGGWVIVPDQQSGEPK